MPPVGRKDCATTLISALPGHLYDPDDLWVLTTGIRIGNMPCGQVKGTVGIEFSQKASFQHLTKQNLTNPQNDLFYVASLPFPNILCLSVSSRITYTAVAMWEILNNKWC